MTRVEACAICGGTITADADDMGTWAPAVRGHNASAVHVAATLGVRLELEPGSVGVDGLGVLLPVQEGL